MASGSRLTVKLRLITGIVLFVFVAGHLANLALGLVSLETLDTWRPVFAAPWTNPVGKPVLMGSMVVHALLSLLAVYRRNTLRLKQFDAIQLLLGLAILPLLLPHVLFAAFAPTLTGAYPSYA